MFRDLNPWMLRGDRLSWNMVARDAAMWLDITGQYTQLHHKEWRAQKECAHDVHTLEHVTEIVYIGRLEDREA